MITFSLDNTEAKRMLENIQKGISDFKPALEEISGVQLKEIEKQFSTEGSNILGEKWQALQADTIKARIRAGFGASPILTASGKMRKSNRKSRLTNTELDISNDVHYFKYHQLGTKKMPRRQIFGHSENMIKKVMDIVAKYIIKIAQS